MSLITLMKQDNDTNLDLGDDKGGGESKDTAQST